MNGLISSKENQNQADLLKTPLELAIMKIVLLEKAKIALENLGGILTEKELQTFIGFLQSKKAEVL